MHAGNLHNIEQGQIVYSVHLVDSIWKARTTGFEQILEYPSKVNKTTFFNKHFRVFLFRSHTKKIYLTRPTKKKSVF